MTYLDNAATTHKKPKSVYKSAGRAYANAGRGGHKLALKTSLMIEHTRELVASFFGVSNPETIAFAPSSTYALNFAIHGILKESDHIIISGMEHNSVARPAFASKAEVSVARPNKKGFVSAQSIEKEIKPNTKMIAITHASNVTGTINPIAEIGKLASDNNILFLVDVAQTAGIIPINVFDNHIDLLAFPSHKHLFGIQGTGGLYIRNGLDISPIIQGGTGTNSLSLTQPTLLPNALEAGTLPAPAIASLGKGIEFINKIGIEEIRRHEHNLTEYLLQRLLNMKNIVVYGTQNSSCQTGTVSFNIITNSSLLTANSISNILSTRYNIATRAGFHCSALAHQSIGTAEIGTIRASLSYFTTKQDIDKLINAIHKISIKS